MPTRRGAALLLMLSLPPHPAAKIRLGRLRHPERRAGAMGDRPFVAMDPAMRSGDPTLNHTRLPVATIAGFVWAGDDVGFVAEEYDITRADVLVACWWM